MGVDVPEVCGTVPEERQEAQLVFAVEEVADEGIPSVEVGQGEDVFFGLKQPRVRVLLDHPTFNVEGSRLAGKMTKKRGNGYLMVVGVLQEVE